MQTNANLLVKLGEADITVDDLTNLNVGDIIQLNTDATTPLDVLVEGVPKFRGIPGILKGNRAIKVTESLIES
jgi:flagellar motor switch protein FliM